MGELDGLRVVVTGGAHGIGRSYCQALARRGAKVAVVDLDGDAAHSLAERLDKESAISVVADVANLDDCLMVADRVVDAFGSVDGLINNAAIFSQIPITRGGFDEIDSEEWDRVMTVNVKGVWHMCRAMVPLMKKKQYGKIVNVSSNTVFTGSAGRCHYVASKAAVLGLTRTLARELGQFGIRVNAVAPGSTLSEEDPTEEVVARRQEAASRRSIPLVQRPEDIVGVVAFLLSSESDFLTGQTIVVDGGEFLH